MSSRLSFCTGDKPSLSVIQFSGIKTMQLFFLKRISNGTSSLMPFSTPVQRKQVKGKMNVCIITIIISHPGGSQSDIHASLFIYGISLEFILISMVL